MESQEKQLSISELIEVGRLNFSLLTKWEKSFFNDVENNYFAQKSISEKQENCLRKIIDEVCIELERMYSFSSHQISHVKKLKKHT